MVRNSAVVLFVSLLTLLASAPSAAQEGARSQLDDIRQWDGLQEMVVRNYGPDFAAMTPDPAASPAPIVDGHILLSGFMAVFDTPEHAQAAFQKFVDTPFELDTGATPAASGVTTESVNDQPEGIGEQAIANTTSYHDANNDVSNAYSRSVVAQQGNVVVLVIAGSFGRQDLAAVNALSAYLANEGSVGTDPVDFHDVGTSTGGIWGSYPPSDGPALAGLVPMSDAPIFPEPTT